MGTDVTYTLNVVRNMADGGPEGRGLVAFQDALLRERYISIRIVDRVAGITLWESRYCSVTNQTWDVAAKGLMSGKITIKAIDLSNQTLV
jgi:hypothetical protein